MKKIIYILTILLLTCCNRNERRLLQDFVVFDSDTRYQEVGFRPTFIQINKAESMLLDYLQTKTKNNETIYVNSLDGKIPLQEKLRFYKRRYFGRINTVGEKIIKIEYVFVRCGGHDEWKQINYTSINTKDCWWSVECNINKNEIFNLNLRNQ